jgi:hypothetical protein
VVVVYESVHFFLFFFLFVMENILVKGPPLGTNIFSCLAFAERVVLLFASTIFHTLGSVGSLRPTLLQFSISRPNTISTTTTKWTTTITTVTLTSTSPLCPHRHLGNVSIFFFFNRDIYYFCCRCSLEIRYIWSVMLQVRWKR